MLKYVKPLWFGLTLLALLASSPSSAMPLASLSDVTSLTIPAAGGCGRGAWRGPWGHCRDTPYYGRLPGGGWKPRPSRWNGCPAGSWHGPWGHCRNTPFHGRLPNDTWQ
jgi:hypothetical protein